MEKRFGLSSFLSNRDKGTQTDARRARIKKTTALLIAGTASLSGCGQKLHPYRLETTNRDCYYFTFEADKKVRLPTGELIWLEEADKAYQTRSCSGKFSDETLNTDEPPPIGEARRRYERDGQ